MQCIEQVVQCIEQVVQCIEQVVQCIKQTAQYKEQLHSSKFVALHLRLEISAMDRHEPTLGNDALERLFFAVDLLVFLESISTAAHETARFMGTSIHLPVLVYSHMLFQIAGRDRRVAAARHGAFKRLLAGVGSNMDFQIAVVRRGVRTVRIGAF